MLKKIFTMGFLTLCIFASQLFAKDTLIVSIPPQKYFIEQIAKDNFTIKIMMDDNLDPTTYKPTAQQYVWAENAIAYFKIGLYDEKKWVHSIKERNHILQTFDTTLNIKVNPIDPHIWLDPMLVRIQAKNILNGLIKIDVKNKEIYTKNYFTFVNKVSSLDYQLRTIFKSNLRNHFIVFHPAWGYFVKRYKLKQLEITADPLLTDKDNIVKIINQINKYASNILFIPKYYFPKTLSEKINNNTKIVSVAVSPLEYDWANNLLNVAKLIAYQP